VWTQLLVSNVSTDDGGKSTHVNYQGFANKEQMLDAYLSELSRVKRTEFMRWDDAEQLAFLINAYNASTVKLILTEWPGIESIKDIGSFFSSPWRKEFISLLGETRSLDEIEHDLIRGSGQYRDPRIHFAVNCASIGCPALRAEAYVGERLDAQLDNQTRLFLSDRSRNRMAGKTLELSSIFSWYREDFEKGWKGFQRLEDFLLSYSESLGLSQVMKDKLRTGNAEIDFLDYDWRLNKQ